jgi:uncharacterized protein (UPF0276 family)
MYTVSNAAHTVASTPKVGIGYRRELDRGIAEHRGSFDCLEIIADSYLQPSRAKLAELERLLADFVLVPHGLRLSVGAVDRPSGSYLADLCSLLDRIAAPYHGDHFAVTAAAGLEFGHLSPLWYTEEGLATVIENTREAQDQLGRQLVLETITQPFMIPGATMSAAEFISRVCDATGCGVLLDVTNIYINATNTGEDSRAFVDALPLGAVRQVHLVGYGREADGTLVDTHAEPVQPELWSLYDHVRRVCRPEFVILERDDNFPDVRELAAEADRARLPLPIR